MKGLVEEGQETIEEGEDKDELTADLALIAAAQRVEHYEISGYGNARCLARQIGEREVAQLLSHTLGEEEAADFLLTTITQPILQQATSVDFGNGTKAPWGRTGRNVEQLSLSPSKARVASASHFKTQPQKEIIGDQMYHHIKELMYTVEVDTPDPAFGNMLLEQFGGANGELAAAMQYSIQGINCEDPGTQRSPDGHWHRRTQPLGSCWVTRPSSPSTDEK